MTDAGTIHRTSTVDMAPLYKWLSSGAGSRTKVSTNPTWKKAKKLMRIELEKRASGGDDLATRILLKHIK